MNLILWRHAEAQECADLQQDMSRKLTARGEKQAKRMANWLDRQLPHNAQIWVSPAVRALQTAEALGHPYKICPELSPQANVQEVLALLQWPRRKGHLLLVGHQPLFGSLIADFMSMRQEYCSIKKGALWWLRSRERDQIQQTVLVTVQTPEFL